METYCGTTRVFAIVPVLVRVAVRERKALKKKTLADVAAVCYVDICKASTYVAKSDNGALRHIVPDIENDLKVR